ncbi:MAG: 23S rRNA (guanosine2251-2'-O)-methyltransferase [Arenicella sp.]|jgi:23S rRNA (guanosine2251-2'-O)-methyltransferase
MRKLSMEELNRDSVEEFKEKQKHPVALVLDNIRSMHNVGSAFRTSDAFLVEKIVLCGITAQPPHREIHKTALGATDSVNWEYSETTVKAVEKLKLEGFKIVIVEQTVGSIALQEFPFNPTEKYAFVFGNEAMGVKDEVLPYADFSLEIPQFGTKHSLNVSVSMGIVLWDYLQKMLK